ncbi:MAG: L-lactate permease [Bradymonadaceae bacterium]|nr:L-lactate permease [Lujinxingiaceae bacterium]
MTALLATIPILTIIVLMVLARRSAAVAGLVGLATTLVLATVVFEFEPIADHDARIWGVAGSLLEAAFTAATILWIIFGALCLHHLQVRTSAIDTIRSSAARLTDDPRLLAVLIAWFFALFLEGAAGFGTPIALAAPFLVSFGFRPAQAVSMALIGHCAGVSFGAVGTPILPMIAVTTYSGLELSRATGIYHALLGWIMLLIVVYLARRGLKDEAGAPESNIWPWVGLGAATFLVPMFAISRWVGPELPTMGGALIGAALFIVALAWIQRRQGASDTEDEAHPWLELLRASSPYLIVIALILVTRLVPPIQAALTEFAITWRLHGRFSGTFQPLYHPGTVLFLGFVIGGWLQRATLADLGHAMRTALGQLGLVAIALVAMLAISRLMVHASMIAVLAEAAASLAGRSWPLFAPFIGVLGSFVTGSATASNILFTDFQHSTATRLELPPLQILGAQGFGAAVGNIISPHNIIAGCATVGITGQEGTILRRTLGVCALYATLGGLLALALAAW